MTESLVSPDDATKSKESVIHVRIAPPRYHQPPPVADDMSPPP